MFITLLSDLGNTDTNVAKIKSILLQKLPSYHVIDVTHNIKPFYLLQAAYLLSSSIQNFQKGSYHICVFDLYYNQNPEVVLAEIDGQYIFAPDNGLLPAAFHDKAKNIWSCFTMSESDNLSTYISRISEIIDKLEGGSPASIGLEETSLKNIPPTSKPQIHDNHMECVVLHIDRFQNAVLNVTREEFEAAAKGRQFSINFMRGESISTISNNYNSVDGGEQLCRYNSAGYLEIAVNNGNAAGLFGFKLIHERQQKYDIIKINFE